MQRPNHPVRILGLLACWKKCLFAGEVSAFRASTANR